MGVKLEEAHETACFRSVLHFGMWVACQQIPKGNPMELINSHTGQQATVLVVDDSAMARFLIQRTLVSFGIATFSAPDGIAAVELLNARRFDAVVTDLEMPRLRGEDLIDRIRRHDCADIRDLPIIVVSSLDDQVTKNRLRFLGANVVLPKPLDIEKLIENARNYIVAC